MCTIFVFISKHFTSLLLLLLLFNPRHVPPAHLILPVLCELEILTEYWLEARKLEQNKRNAFRINNETINSGFKCRWYFGTVG